MSGVCRYETLDDIGYRLEQIQRVLERTLAQFAPQGTLPPEPCACQVEHDGPCETSVAAAAAAARRATGDRVAEWWRATLTEARASRGSEGD